MQRMDLLVRLAGQDGECQQLFAFTRSGALRLPALRQRREDEGLARQSAIAARRIVGRRRAQLQESVNRS